MPPKILSVFVDESGDFGPYDQHCPYYLVSLVLHDQKVNIHQNAENFDAHLRNENFPLHAIHAGPLIRREKTYATWDRETRRRLFNALFNFARKLDIQYTYVLVPKYQGMSHEILISTIVSSLKEKILQTMSFWKSYTQINVYYDNGQNELTNILKFVFNDMFANVEFRKVAPVDYKLFQIADMTCTLELLQLKLSMTKSEDDFFNGKRNLKKNYLNPMRKKCLA